MHCFGGGFGAGWSNPAAQGPSKVRCIGRSRKNKEYPQDGHGDFLGFKDLQASGLAVEKRRSLCFWLLSRPVNLTASKSPKLAGSSAQLLAVN